MPGRLRLAGSEAAPTGKRSYWKPANQVAVLGLSVGKRQAYFAEQQTGNPGRMALGNLIRQEVER